MKTLEEQDKLERKVDIKSTNQAHTLANNEIFRKQYKVSLLQHPLRFNIDRMLYPFIWNVLIWIQLAKKLYWVYLKF